MDGTVLAMVAQGAEGQLESASIDQPETEPGVLPDGRGRSAGDGPSSST